MIASARRCIVPAAVATIAGLLAGCGGQFGSEIKVHARPLEIRAAEASTTIRLPQDRPFGIFTHNSSRQPGLDGSAEAEDQARPDGSALARAGVKEVGKASAEFQVGDVFANQTERQLDLVFRVSYRYEFEVGSEPARLLPDAAARLRLYARGARGELLRQIALVDASTEAGPGQGRSDDTRQFTLTIGPGGTLTVWLAGQAQVDIQGEHSANAELRLSGLQFEVVTHPAPAVQTAPPAPSSSGAAPARGAAAPSQSTAGQPTPESARPDERR